MKNSFALFLILFLAYPLLGQTPKPLPKPQQANSAGTTIARKTASAQVMTTSKTSNASASRSSGSAYKPKSLSLYEALETCRQQDIAYFINAGNVNKPLPNGYSPLNKAIYSGCSIATIRMLIQKGADVSGVDQSDVGVAPIHAAAGIGNLEVLKFLKLQGASIGIRTKLSKSSVLGVAAAGGHLKVCQWLIEQGVDAKYDNDGEGYTALHSAAASGHVDVCQFLIEQGIDINKITDFNATPLYMAAYSGKINVCKFLIENGAVVNGNIIRVAESEGHTAVVALLRQHGAK